MVQALRSAFPATTSASPETSRAILKVDGHQVLCVLDAIPAALTVSAAREMVGQPFLRDYLLAAIFSGEVSGPLHVIACQKSATEVQATKLLGFPDAMVVSAPFGVFVADPVQMVQFAFIVNCRDESSTRHGLQRFLEWLSQTGEDIRVAARAQSRSRIIGAIARETAGQTTPKAPPEIVAGKPEAGAKKRRGTA